MNSPFLGHICAILTAGDAQPVLLPELSANPLSCGTNSSSSSSLPSCRALSCLHLPGKLHTVAILRSPGCCCSLQAVFLWLRVMVPGEDAPQINAHSFPQAQFSNSPAALMGTLEEPELAAETTNNLRGTAVITAREAERGVFISS